RLAPVGAEDPTLEVVGIDEERGVEPDEALDADGVERPGGREPEAGLAGRDVLDDVGLVRRIAGDRRVVDLDVDRAVGPLCDVVGERAGLFRIALAGHDRQGHAVLPSPALLVAGDRRCAGRPGAADGQDRDGRQGNESMADVGLHGWILPSRNGRVEPGSAERCCHRGQPAIADSGSKGTPAGTRPSTGAGPDGEAPGGWHDAQMRTVLIVDDHAAFRSAARLMLERGGFEVVGEAVDADTAVEAAARLRPEVVLLDVQLPGDDGFRTCERILDASDGGGIAPPIVVLTSAWLSTSWPRRRPVDSSRDPRRPAPGHGSGRCWRRTWRAWRRSVDRSPGSCLAGRSRSWRSTPSCRGGASAGGRAGPRVSLP